MTQTDFIYWLNKQRINLKKYQVHQNGDLEFVYNGRLMLFEKSMLDNADKWTGKQKKIVLDMIRHGGDNKKGKKNEQRTISKSKRS